MSEWRTNTKTKRPFRMSRTIAPDVSAPRTPIEVPDKNVINFANQRADEGWTFRHAEPQPDGSVEETWTKEDNVLFMRYNSKTNEILSVEVA